MGKPEQAADALKEALSRELNMGERASYWLMRQKGF
jgi:hypothetical protein